MSFLKSVWADLIEKRLWPFAAALLVALALVPVALGRGGDAAPVAAGTGTTATGATAQTAQVLLDPALPDRRDRVGTMRNPFTPRVAVAKPAAPKGAVSSVVAPGTDTAPTPDGGGGAKPGGGGGGGGVPITPPGGSAGTSPLPEAPKPTRPRPEPATNYRVVLRFGRAWTVVRSRPLDRLTPLPSSDVPALVLLGVLEGEGRAVFLLSTDVKAEGEGICKPRRSSCETLELRKGDKEMLSITGADGKVDRYQLELLRIVKLAAADAPSTAVAARAAAAGTGNELGSDRYAFNARTGRLRRVFAAPRSRPQFRAAPSVTRETLAAFGVLSEALGAPRPGPSR